MSRQQVVERPEAIEMYRYSSPIKVGSDEQLLRQFLTLSDESAEAAFTALVERHAPLVLRVCNDVLGSVDDSQDAAQGVFLVLASRARSIRNPEVLGSWLHGVALRIARRARVEAAQRKSAEKTRAETFRQSETMQTASDALDHAELHEELDRLPEKYRIPIILFYMQAKTQVEVADALGWPLGTVQIRLHRGRERLRSSLTKRGFGITGAGLLTSLTSKASVPTPNWIETTAAAAVRFAARKDVAPLVSPIVSRLAWSMRPPLVSLRMKIAGLVAITLVFFVAVAPSKKLPADAPSHGIAQTKPGNVKVVRSEAITKISSTETHTSGLSIAQVPKSSVVPSVDASKRTPPEQPIPTMVPLDSPRKPRTSLGETGILAMNEVADEGKELFERVWMKDDRRGHGGDGLGPVFNGVSCVACHFQGGTGGAGGVDRNIEIATIDESIPDGSGYAYSFSMDFGNGQFEYRIGNDSGATTRSGQRFDTRALTTIHPGFQEGRSVILHRFGVDPEYNAWRVAIAGSHGSIMTRMSERNPPPLFGIGLIDAIPNEVIEAGAKRRASIPASVRGRVSRLKDGRIGRFGWKGQTATLQEFVMSAAAGEIGLEVPGRRQASDPRLPGFAAPGLDMDEAECKALLDYTRSLPAPVKIEAADAQESAQLKAGENTFKAIGCAHCHTPKLGDVEGIYSDLLLHEMSSALGDADGYSVFTGDTPKAKADTAAEKSTTASIREWRTPPLWGLRDSNPYLHDGRASSLDQAIALHAGQGASSAKRFAELSARRKRHLNAFLMSLTTPSQNR